MNQLEFAIRMATNDRQVARKTGVANGGATHGRDDPD